MPNNINYQTLLKGIRTVIERGDYPEFLKMINKLRNNYSFRNTLLVYVQNPRPTFVKGYCDWNKLGRGVKGSPRKIYIYAKMGKSKEKDEALIGQQDVEGNEVKEKNKSKKVEIIDGVKYKRVVVYDISDTYVLKGAKRIPILDDKIDGDTTKDLYNRLIDISPVPVAVKELSGSTKGYYDLKNNEICIESNLSPDERTALLIHELCHCLYDKFDYSKEREKSEIFVESVAFLVADYFKFDTSLCSFGYIVNWARNDLKEFLKLSNKIKETADEFIELIKVKDYEQEKISA